MAERSKQSARGGGELALIERIRRDSARRTMGRVRLGIGDDCAVIQPPAGHEILVTTDLCLEGRHFRRDWHTAESAGHRCLARGLSDLAAMGARPLAAFLSLALPAGTAGRWTAGFFRGLRALADEYAVPLAGGDTAQSPSGQILADIVLIGSAPAGTALRRSTARAGDLIYVTGRLGGAAAELIGLQGGAELAQNGTTTRSKQEQTQIPFGNDKNRNDKCEHDKREHPQLFPEPRLAVGETLRRRGLASAAIDLSDGLSSDLRHLCEASGLSAEIELPMLPVHPLAAGGVDLALHGGEDYELLFAARPGVKMPRSIAGVGATRIGRFVARGRPLMVQIDERGRRRPLIAGGWEHKIG